MRGSSYATAHETIGTDVAAPKSDRKGDTSTRFIVSLITNAFDPKQQVSACESSSVRVMLLIYSDEMVRERHGRLRTGAATRCQLDFWRWDIWLPAFPAVDDAATVDTGADEGALSSEVRLLLVPVAATPRSAALLSRIS